MFFDVLVVWLVVALVIGIVVALTILTIQCVSVVAQIISREFSKIFQGERVADSHIGCPGEIVLKEGVT